MSIKLMSLVWESSLPSEQKLVLLALADHARDDGSRVFPSVASVAVKTSMSERTVQRHISFFRKHGLLEVVQEANRYTPTEYLIRGDKLAPLTGVDKNVEIVLVPESRGDTGGGQGCHERRPGVTPAAAYIKGESSGNHHGSGKPPRKAEKIALEKARDAWPLVVSAWNKHKEGMRLAIHDKMANRAFIAMGGRELMEESEKAGRVSLAEARFLASYCKIELDDFKRGAA